MKRTALEVGVTGFELRRSHVLVSRPRAGYAHSPNPSALMLSGLDHLLADA